MEGTQVVGHERDRKGVACTTGRFTAGALSALQRGIAVTVEQQLKHCSMLPDTTHPVSIIEPKHQDPGTRGQLAL